MNNLQLLKEELVKIGKIFPLYMDYQSTTPLDSRVLESMLPFFKNQFGNPHSRTHSYGWEAEVAIERAREQVAQVIGAHPKEIIFTSGATESNNLAIKGLAKFYGKSKTHIIVLSTEHKCVLNCCRYLQEEGFHITYLPVNPSGLVDLELLQKSITKETLLVSVMAVHNEIGVIQPLAEIGKICRANGVFFHSDIAQGYGKIPINVDECNIDLASISGHKFYGPKGVGALYIRKKPRVRISPLINGGGQERGVRSGTLSPALVVGMGKAAEIALQEMTDDFQKVKKLYNKFVKTIMHKIPDVFLNGDSLMRYPGNINLSFSCVEGESMIGAIRDLAVSSGSACTSASLESSYVLRALGVDDGLAHTSIRFGIGRFTTELEIDYAIALICQKIEKLREMSPLWEMVKEGINIKEINWTTH